MDQLKKLREKVIKANSIYDDVRIQVSIPETDEYRRQTIKDLSDPFVKGVFTLAVIGPMSAGKSAFINALLGDEDLLPTGHFQTTCTLTEISWSKEKRLKIVYGDGHVDDTTKGDGVLSKLKGIVSIPEEFDKLPINHINQFILAGDTYEDILKNKEILIKLSGRSCWEEGDDDLLKKYVMSKKPSNIPVHVYLYYPLDSTFNGWRIVDTPGIGAIGGIDQTTKDFLSNDSVDAAIFVFNGVKEIEEQGINDVVNTSYSQLTDVAKERTFFVITHKGASTCYNNLESTTKKALQLFSKGNVSIPQQRFVAVDSMLSLLYDISISKYGFDPMIYRKDIRDIYKHFGVKDIANEKEKKEKKAILQMYQEMMTLIYNNLVQEDDEIEVNSEVLSEEIRKFAGFELLRKLLGDFAANAKIEAYKKLISTIVSDFESFGSLKKEQAELKKLKITKTPEEFARLIAAKKKQIKEYSESLQEKYNELIIEFKANPIKAKYYSSILDETNERIRSSKTIFQFQLESDIESAVQNYYSAVKLKDETVFQKFVVATERLTREEMEEKIPGIAMKPIDTTAEVKKASLAAEKKATKSVKKERWVTTSKIIRFISLGFAGKKKETYYEDEVDYKKKIEETKTEAIVFLNKYTDDHCSSIEKDVVIPSGLEVQHRLDTLLSEKNKEYEDLINSQTEQDVVREEISKLESELAVIIASKGEIERL